MTPYVIIMVGLPGRGKSYVSRRLERWLNWKGLKTKIFNLGDYRRNIYPESTRSDWFDPQKGEELNIRDQLACKACIDLLSWIENDGGIVGIIDATNCTPERRKLVFNGLTRPNSLIKPNGLTRPTMTSVRQDRILFVEMVCEIEEIVVNNVLEAKLTNGDYLGSTPEHVLEDFFQRIDHYRKRYIMMSDKDEPNYKFIQIHNLGEKLVAIKLNGQLDKKLAYFLMNLHPRNIEVFITRHGESIAQKNGVIGTDSDLTEKGKHYGDALKCWIDQATNDYPRVRVMSSYLNRAVKTATPFQNTERYEVSQWNCLNEINGGSFEGLSYSEVETKWPEIYQQRQSDKYQHSWPGGETYRQMIIRLESVFLEIESSPVPLVIIAHQAVCRGLYAYLMHQLPEECTKIDIPSHTVFRFWTSDGHHPQVDVRHL